MKKIDICGIDYLEFYVGNLLQATHFYKTVFGFTPVAYRDNDEYAKDGISVLLKQNNIYLILTSSISSHTAISQHVNKHGDGIKDIALSTNDIEHTFTEAIKLGAVPILPPTIIEDDGCKIIKAIIATFGDTQHTFIQRTEKSQGFLPNFKSYNNIEIHSASDLLEIDHLAICVAGGTLAKWSNYYKDVLNFEEMYSENIYNGNSGMNSVVMQNSIGNCKFTMLEPVSGIDKSQIQKFLDAYDGDGVQHAAFMTEDIIKSVDKIRRRGIDFLTIPKAYYTALPERISELQNVEDLEKLQILVDRDNDGLLFQIFSKVIQTRPTFFIEVIQRQGAKRFGSGNIKALFEAVAREQKEYENK